VGRLQNKVALVTGAAQGIGAAIASLFCREGARLALFDIEREKLDTVAHECSRTGEKPMTFALDITDGEKFKQAVEEIKRRWGRIDVLINNAGIVRDALTVTATRESLEDVLRTNLIAPFFCAQSVLYTMVKQKSGVIINAASVSVLGNIGQAAYAAGKAGLIGLTKTWALEYAPYQIRVNAVAPGFTKTAKLDTVPGDILEQVRQRTPLKRFAAPEEIANAYCFLASDDASFITGQVLFVDGGLSCGF
jgi:3-oxoacyl-[acyl-carrier protein] reductase